MDRPAEGHAPRDAEHRHYGRGLATDQEPLPEPDGARSGPASRSARFRPRIGLEWVVVGSVAAAVVARGPLGPLLERPSVQNWTTILVALVVQAVPFLVLGSVVSGAIAAFVPAGALARALPRRDAIAVPLGGLAGAVLPGCECGSVPVAGRLVERGARAPAALAFMLAAPALNPVVLVATAVAFPGRPRWCWRDS